MSSAAEAKRSKNATNPNPDLSNGEAGVRPHHQEPLVGLYGLRKRVDAWKEDWRLMAHSSLGTHCLGAGSLVKRLRFRRVAHAYFWLLPRCKISQALL